MKTSSLETTFDYYWRTLNGPTLEREYRFDTVRKFRFDRAHVPSRVAIEVQGGTHNNGRHSRAQGYSQDCYKSNLATLQGWRLFRLTSDMLANDPAGHLEPIIEMIGASEC